MEILNIDAFAEVKRQLSYKGKTYSVEEISVQDFINNMKAAEALEKAGGADKTLSKHFEDAVAMICQAIPTFPEAEVRLLKMPAMTAVMQFIRGDMDKPTADAQAEGDAAKKPD